MKNKSSLYLITKPNQLFVILSIIKQVNNCQIDLVVMDNFQNSNAFSNVLEKENKWRKVYLVKDKMSIIKYHFINRYDKLYTDSDVGFVNFSIFLIMKVLNKNLIINVFEEGLGTYFSNLFFYKFLKRNFFKFLGIGTYFGSSRFTSEIYVFDKKKYEKVNLNEDITVIEIKNKLIDIFEESKILINKLYPLDRLKNQIKLNKHKSFCTVILGTYFYEQKQFQATFSNLKKTINSLNIDESNNFVIIKNHPHRTNSISYNNFRSNIYVDPSIPAEILIWLTLKFYSKINIIHSGSSVLQYFNPISFIEYDYDVLQKINSKVNLVL